MGKIKQTSSFITCTCQTTANDISIKSFHSNIFETLNLNRKLAFILQHEHKTVVKFVVGINNKERLRLEYVLSCAWRLSHQFQVLFRATSSVLIINKWPQQLLSINIKLVLVLNIQVQNIVHFLCVWSLMYPTRVLSSYLMCSSSLSSASLKLNSSIQVFP